MNHLQQKVRFIKKLFFAARTRFTGQVRFWTFLWFYFSAKRIWNICNAWSWSRERRRRDRSCASWRNPGSRSLALLRRRPGTWRGNPARDPSSDQSEGRPSSRTGWRRWSRGLAPLGSCRWSESSPLLSRFRCHLLKKKKNISISFPHIYSIVGIWLNATIG